MKNENTREEILAEREAKKLAKLNAKKKLNASTSTPTDDPKSKSSGNAGSKPKETPHSTAPGKKGKAAIVNNPKEERREMSGANDSGSTIDVSSLKMVGPSIEVLRSIDKKLQTLSISPKTVTQASHHRKKGDTDQVNETECPVVHSKESKMAAESAELVGGSVDKELTKAELKAARRLKQEMQRAAKANQQNVVPPTLSSGTQDSNKLQDKTTKKKEIVKAIVKNEVVKTSMKPKVELHKVKLFNHLYYDEDPTICSSIMLESSGLHPALISLGLQYASRIIMGSNARCYSLMNALKRVIEDYTTPQQKEFARGLESSLQPCVAFLQRCRPMAVSMTNAIKYLKWHMTQLPNDVTDEEAKKKLQEVIDTYLSDQIDVAAQAICITVQKKISNGDVILTYGCSSLVQRILIEAHEIGTKFRVVIVDAHPWREGLQLLHRLGQHGIRCSYVLIGAASCMMREATKVLLGAHALLANGYVMSRAGSSQVALVARAYNVPVIVCCETHKFSERVQTDALVHNELGDPDSLASCKPLRNDEPLANWRNIASLTPLNLTYDVTPPDYVNAVVTELAYLPCSSVPVILRIKPTDSHH